MQRYFGLIFLICLLFVGWYGSGGKDHYADNEKLSFGNNKDLEIYSDDKNDLSNLTTYEDFLKDYRQIIKDSISLLKENRFVCFVVGDIRDKKGFYRNFVSDTISAFQNAGMILYNEAVLVTSVGSLPIRVGKQFSSYRKLGKTHQNVLIFYKGDPKVIKQDFGEIKLDDSLFSDIQ